MSNYYFCNMLKSTLLKAADAAGKLIQERINGKFTIEFKDGPNNLVTEVDKASEALIMEIIKKEFPSHFILSEEIGEVKMDSNYKWIIDPIDGTINFANGIPLCCVSIGLEKDDKMIMGAVYNPILNEFFFTEKGQGAFLNDRRLEVSKQHQVKHACLVTGFP
jgi:myo-inositol-1(or 4)-monophosphatase